MNKFKKAISVLLIATFLISLIYPLEIKGNTDEIKVQVFRDDNLNYIKDDNEKVMSNVTVTVEYFKKDIEEEDEDINVYDGYEVEEYTTDVNGEVIFTPKNPLYSISIDIAEGENYGFIENKYFSIEKERVITEHLFGARDIDSIEVGEITTSEDEIDYSELKDNVKAFDAEGNLLICDPVFTTESDKQITEGESLDLDEDSADNQKDIKVKKEKKIKVKAGKKNGVVKIKKKDKVYKSVKEKLKDLKDKNKISEKEYYKNLIYSIYDPGKLSKAATENVEENTEPLVCGTEIIYEIESYCNESNDVEIKNELNKYSPSEMQHRITDTYVTDSVGEDSVNVPFKTMSLNNTSDNSFTIMPLASITDKYDWNGTNISITVNYDTSGTHASNEEYAKKIVAAVKKSYGTYKDLGYKRPDSFSIYVRQIDARGTAYSLLGKIDIKRGMDDVNLYSTVAHEIFHTIQYKYNAVQPSFWLTEASAARMETRVYPEYNGYSWYIKDLFNNMHYTLDCGEPKNQEYACAAFMYFLEEYDSDIIRKIYENHKWTLIGGDRTVNVIDSTLKGMGYTNGFAEAYEKFATYCYKPKEFFERGKKDDWPDYPSLTMETFDAGLKNAKDSNYFDRMSSRFYRFKTSSTASRRITLLIAASYNILDCHTQPTVGNTGIGLIVRNSSGYQRRYKGKMNSGTFTKYITIDNYRTGGISEFGLVLSNCNIDDISKKQLSFEVNDITYK